MRLVHAGPNARYLVFEEPPSRALSRRIGAAARALRRALPTGEHDVVPGYADILVEGRRPVPDAWLLEAGAGASRMTAPEDEPRSFVVPVDYGDRADVGPLEERLGLPWDEIVALHSAPTYSVAYLGFTPGFPYLHGLNPRLATPRRERPRQSVPAGAVAIANGQAGIYPSTGPGGWWLLGTTDFGLFDPERPEPTALRTGDELRFVQGGPGAAGDHTKLPSGHPTSELQVEPLVEVLEVWPGSASLQGRPRLGVGHHGLADAGALDQALFLSLSFAVGAPLGEAALELTVPHALLRARSKTPAAFGGAAEARLEGKPLEPGRPFEWRAGETLEFRPPPKGPRQLAGVPLLVVAGGFAPLGGPVGHPDLAVGGSTDVRGRVGGFGRWLCPGDVLAQAALPSRPPAGPAALGHYRPELALRLHPGPHHEVRAFAALQTRTFVVSERSRMGVRLEFSCRAAEADTEASILSTGMPLGAVQLPPDGRPLVLLADRGRTGGYPVVGVVDRADLAALAQARPATKVRFLVPGEHASF